VPAEAGFTLPPRAGRLHIGSSWTRQLSCSATPASTATSWRAGPRRIGPDVTAPARHPTARDCRSAEGCGGGRTGAAPGGAAEGRGGPRWPERTVASPTPSATSDARATARATSRPASSCCPRKAGSAGCAPARNGLARYSVLVLSGGSSSLVCALGGWSMTCRRRRPLLRRRSLPYRVCVEGAVADGWRPLSRVVRGDSDGRRGSRAHRCRVSTDWHFAVHAWHEGR
jgi:hypothetical protein